LHLVGTGFLGKAGDRGSHEIESGHSGERYRVRHRSTFRLIDHRRADADGQLRAETQKIVPVEAIATSRVPLTANTSFAATRRRNDDSPPRICGPKLFVRI